MPIMGSWSAMRKYLENEMLCESLQGRVRYYLTSYPNMDGSGHFEVFVDGESIKIFSMEHAASRLYETAEGNIDFGENFWSQKDKPKDHQSFDDEDFAEALRIYRSSSISESINSPNSIVRMFAILDRRLGKRTLHQIKDRVSDQPDWLKVFYNLRMSCI